MINSSSGCAVSRQTPLRKPAKVSAIDWLLLALAVCLPISIFFLATQESFNFRVYGMVSFIPVSACLWEFLKRKAISMLVAIPVVGLHWVYFVRPFLSSKTPTYPLRVDPMMYADRILIISTLSIWCFYLSYRFTLKKPLLKPLFPGQLRLSNSSLNTIVGVFYLCGWLLRCLRMIAPNVAGSMGELLMFVDFMPLFAISASLLGATRRVGGLCSYVAFSIFVIIESMYYAYGTLFTYFAFLVVALAIVLFYSKRRIPYLWLSASILLTLPIYQYRSVARSEIWQTVETSPLNALATGWNVICDSYAQFYSNLLFGDTKENKVEEVEIDRLENVTFLAQCMKRIDMGKPYKYGQTMWYIPLAIVPRIIFPWKPVNTHCWELPEEYGVKEPSWNCAINFPWLVEWYVNFGATGAVLGSGIMGALFALFVKYAGYGKGDYSLGMLIHAMTWVVKVEVDVVMVLSGLIQIAIVWKIISLFIGNSPERVRSCSRSSVRKAVAEHDRHGGEQC